MGNMGEAIVMGYPNEIANKYNAIVTGLLEEQKCNYVRKETSDYGYEYTIKSEEATLVVTINLKWIGYDLSIRRRALGKDVGTHVDTDLYPLDYDRNVTEEIAEETIQCVKALLSRDIYIGKDHNKYYLAVPIKNGYRLEKKRRAIVGFVVTSEEISTKELQKKDFLRSIK